MRDSRDGSLGRPGRFACEALGPGKARGHKNLGDKNRGQQKVSGPK